MFEGFFPFVRRPVWTIDLSQTLWEVLDIKSELEGGVKTYSPPQGTLAQQCIAGLDHWSMISSGAAVVRLEQDGNKTATSQGRQLVSQLVS